MTKKITLFLLAILCLPVFAKSKLPVLSSKQSASNLRFFTYDGKSTYYQRRSGSLLMSTNYRVKEIIKAKVGSQYVLSATRNRKNIVVELNESFHNFYSARANKRILVIPFGGIDIKEIGRGVKPRLHLEDQWVSFFHYSSKRIFFRSLLSEALNFTVSLNNTKNPFFLPQVQMVSTKKVLFTDLNSKGFPGVMLLDRNSNKVSNLYKIDKSTYKIELCSLSNEQIIVGVFPKIPNTESPMSEISILSAKDLDFGKREIIYTSQKSDIGNMVCSHDGKSVFFIQDQSTEDKMNTNAVELTLADKKVTTLSDVNDALNMNYVDGMLLLPNKGKLLIMKGDKNLKDADIIGN